MECIEKDWNQIWSTSVNIVYVLSHMIHMLQIQVTVSKNDDDVGWCSVCS
jgi:hypothetical protein